ncbi:MAG: GNAT family N-acetyltransferase [Gammaproteobacteria bacterium]|nr:GNAT family N-acetyltransferase [Gammaproteobacteria bacterium]
MLILETDRLVLRPFTWDDFEFINALHADPEVARYIGYGKPRTAAENRDLLENTLKAYSDERLGHLAVSLKVSGALIGRCGLSLLEVEAKPAGDLPPQWFWNRGSAPADMTIEHRIEIGYTFARQHWGHGYATEGAKAIRDFVFQSRREEQLVAAISPENTASINVAKKLGFSFRGPIIAFGKSAEHHQIDRVDWGNLSSG